jgi:hypothetical protein
MLAAHAFTVYNRSRISSCKRQMPDVCLARGLQKLMSSSQYVRLLELFSFTLCSAVANDTNLYLALRVNNAVLHKLRCNFVLKQNRP